jgi:XTP/dITP diphosphohydrolase
VKLVFATNNINKVKEIRQALTDIEIVSLKEAGIDKDIPEPYQTLEENATEKSMTIYNMTRQNCFSEDTGLEVEALDGAPGVLSARYAGENATYADNVNKLLHEMEGKENRKARFRTVISLIIEGKEKLFEGICEGRIIAQTKGENGFGYDPVFVPESADCTFAEMTMEEKRHYSHRARAVEKLVQYLKGSRTDRI